MMQLQVAFAVLCLFLACTVQGFLPSSSRYASKQIIQAREYASSSRQTTTTSLCAVKPDLFSDDLFEDDEDSSAPSGKNAKEGGAGVVGGAAEAPKKKYLEQKWKLNSEDAKDFKGFPKKGVDASDVDKVTAAAVPVFALMYKFRREYLEASTDAVLADHKGHCAKYKRLLNTEVINLGKAKGVVLMWAGFTETDKDDTKAEIMNFLEDDPFIVKDIVENWDLIDLSKGQVGAAEAEAVPALPKV